VKNNIFNFNNNDWTNYAYANVDLTDSTLSIVNAKYNTNPNSIFQPFGSVYQYDYTIIDKK